MSSQNLCLDQRMKGKDGFPYTVPWRDSLVRWAKVGLLSACAVGSVLPAVGLATTIQGMKFNDLNGNGIRDKDALGNWIEPGLPNEAIFVRERTIKPTQTGSDGSFSYQSASGGSFSVWTQLPPTGWVQTAPQGKTTYVMQLTQDQTVTGIDFGIKVANSLPAISQLTVNGSVPADGVAQVDEGITVALKAGFTDADSIDTHTVEWNFGDGSPIVNTQEATHTYVASTTPYAATFTVKDSQGGVAIGRVQVKVAPNNLPAVNLEDTTVVAGDTVNFVGNVTDPDTIDTHTFSWTMGDDTVITATQNASYTFNQVGEYNVKLTVTDSRGGVASDTMKVTVNPELRVLTPEQLDSTILVDGEPVSAHQTTTVENDHYYTSSGQKATFQRLENYVFVMNKPNVTTTVQLFNESVLPPDTSNPFGKGNIYKFSNGQATTQAVVQFSSQTSQDGEVEYVSPIMTTGKGDAIVVTNQIVVAKRNADGISGRTYHQEFLSEMERLGLRLVHGVELSKDNYVFEITSPYTDVSKVFELVQTLSSSPYVKWSEPNFLVTLMPHIYQPATNPLYGNQWHLNNVGSNGGSSDADIDAPEGWEIKKGENVIIAINDDGVENHPDLSIAPGGWDFTEGDNDPTPSDSTNNHGTSVAGVAAAQDNNIGVVGSAMKATILPVRVTSGGQCSDFAASILYGAKYAHVANHSWGIGVCQSEIDSAIQDAVMGNIAGSLRGPLGTPMVFASGNSASGWVKFSVTGFPAGTYSLRWKFSKDSGTSSGYDTMWLDDITLPGGQAINFENDTVNTIPSGFTSGGNQQWKVISDGIHARVASGNSVKAGTITDSQETHLDLMNVTVGAGTLTFWAWVSSEQSRDWFTLHYSLNGGSTWSSIVQYTPGQYGHQNEVGYPASNPYAIAVGASSDGWSGQEERSSYSQFGPELDVVAPSNSQGQGITTTDRIGSAGYSSTDYTSTFGGTSSAAPLTTGVIATLLSNNPNLTAQEVDNCLKAGADKIGEYNYPNQSDSAISLNMEGTGGRNDFYGYGRVNLERTLKACMPSPDPCESPTRTLSSGNLSTAGLTPNDVVLIQNGTVMADMNIAVKGLCVKETGVLEGNPDVVVEARDASSFDGAIRNYGTIRGKNGENASSNSPDGKNGGIVDLTTSHFFNGMTGKIHGGRGGDDVAYSYTGQNGLSKGGMGGDVNIYADKEAINHGKIGPSPMHKASSTNPSPGCSNTTPTFYWYEFDNSTDTIAGGNGGMGSSWDGNSWQTGSSHVSDNAKGGDGGLTTVMGESITNGSTGRISGGYGGDAKVYYCHYTPIFGSGGGATLIPMGGDIYGLGEINGGDGNVWIEPRIILSDASLRIRNAENVTIFGGDDTTLSLNNLSSQAIVANNKITLAVGKNGVVDLTGSAGDALKAGNQLEILADSVILSDNMEMEDVSDAPSVEVQPGKILYHVTLSGIGDKGAPNTTVPVKVRVVNSGPTTDTYTLTVTDSAGWQLGTLPTTITVEGLKSTELELNVTLPAKAGATDTITVTAISHSDSTVGAKTEVMVVVESETGNTGEIGSYKASGSTLSNATVTVTKMDNSQVTQTTTTDANGQWTVTGLPAGNYTATVSAPGYNSVVQQFEVSETNAEVKVITSPPHPLLTLKMTSSPTLVRPGEKVTYTLTVANRGTGVATGVGLKLTLPTGLTLDQLNGDTCDASQLSCTLPNLDRGDNATVTLVVIAGSEGGKFDLSAILTSNEYPSDVSTATLALLPYLSVTPSCAPTTDVPMLGDWQCDWTVELSPDAPEAIAKDVQVTITIPQGVTVQSATADVGTVTSQTAKVLWTLEDDLSTTGVNRATLSLAMKLTDMFLLALAQEAKVMATNYPAQTARARTAILIDDSIKVDIALVVDITGSMQGEIDGVKAALKKFIATIDASQSPTVALVVFKDVATVKAFTKDLTVLLKVIDSLTADGGGTCPEASVEALAKAARHVKAGGQIWFTTDASPYPDSDVPGVLDLLKTQNIRFNATVTGDCGDVNSLNE